MARRLSEGLDERESIRTVQAFFNPNVRPLHFNEYRSYITHYHDELCLLRFGLSEQWVLPTLPIQTHAQLRNMVQWLSVNQDCVLSSLRDRAHLELSLPEAKPQAFQECIELALRLWLTLNIRNDAPESVKNHTPIIKWPQSGKQLAAPVSCMLNLMLFGWTPVLD